MAHRTLLSLGQTGSRASSRPVAQVNPIGTLAEDYKLMKTHSNYSSLETFTEKDADDYTSLIDTFNKAYSTVEQDAGYIQTLNFQDSQLPFRSEARRLEAP